MSKYKFFVLKNNNTLLKKKNKVVMCDTFDEVREYITDLMKLTPIRVSEKPLIEEMSKGKVPKDTEFLHIEKDVTKHATQNVKYAIGFKLTYMDTDDEARRMTGYLGDLEILKKKIKQGNKLCNPMCCVIIDSSELATYTKSSLVKNIKWLRKHQKLFQVFEQMIYDGDNND